MGDETRIGEACRTVEVTRTEVACRHLVSDPMAKSVPD